jgi:hypothetical protein
MHGLMSCMAAGSFPKIFVFLKLIFGGMEIK